MHVITGLPRSGSTLLCNILNQNPNFWASSTSILPQLWGNMISNWSNSVEIKGALSLDRSGTEDRLRRSLKAFCDSWHFRDDGRKIVFDKSRGWLHNILSLREVYPDSKIIITVRDLRSIFSSVEKQHRKTALLDDSRSSKEKTIYDRADKMFSDKGLIGGPLSGIEDVLRRRLDNIYWVKYEEFSKSPELIMHQLYLYLEETPFTHDFDNVINTATDPDAYYNFKFPHRGEGKVVPVAEDDWKDFIIPELASKIMNSHPYFNAHLYPSINV